MNAFWSGGISNPLEVIEQIRLRNIKPDFAAIIAPGLHLAFEDRRKVRLSGKTIMGEDATREVWVEISHPVRLTSPVH